MLSFPPLKKIANCRFLATKIYDSDFPKKIGTLMAKENIFVEKLLTAYFEFSTIHYFHQYFQLCNQEKLLFQILHKISVQRFISVFFWLVNQLHTIQAQKLITIEDYKSFCLSVKYVLKVLSHRFLPISQINGFPMDYA